MTYAAHHQDFASYVRTDSAPQGDAVAKRRGILRFLSDAIHRSRQKQADREIARFLAHAGGRFTDNLERELMRRVSTSNWNVHE